MQQWRASVESIKSKGRTAKKVSRMADLHDRRAETQGQFFTPAWVARSIWSYLAGYVQNLHQLAGQKINVVDTSIGSGRLFDGAPNELINIYGVDIDGRCIELLSRDGGKAGIDYELLHCGIEGLRVQGMDIAVINPPFSISLSDPRLEPYSCTHFGRFGKNTGAKSHEYALDQALDAARLVVAILPDSMLSFCQQRAGLVEVISLPASTFLNEGANVKTSIFVFQKGFKGSVRRASWSETSGIERLHVRAKESPRGLRFQEAGVDVSSDVITLPVTHNPRVEMHHHNRKIVLKYFCGLTEAKVKNGLLMAKAEGKRLPKEIRYVGDGMFYLDAMLLRSNKEEQLDLLAEKINSLGGKAVISPTLAGFYQKLLKRHRRAIEPMHRTVLEQGSNKVVLEAKRRTFLNPSTFSGPTIPKGMLVDAELVDGEYQLSFGGEMAVLRRDDVVKRYDILRESSGESQWVVKHEGLPVAFPALATQYAQMIKNAGIDWLEAFQEFSVIEGMISPCGYIGAWQQGSGKSRKAIAVALLSSGKSLIVVEPGLMPELKNEFKKLNISESLWGEIQSGDMPTKKISITTYNVLRAGTKVSYLKDVTKGNKIEEKRITKMVRTNADRWRNQFNVVLCDEGSLLCNLDTQQTRAVKRLNARKLIVLDGTPQRNYARDLLPLAVASAGNGVAHQPYGTKGKPFIFGGLVDSANKCMRGEDMFYDRHVVVEWVTHQFKEDLNAGAKREVPKINELSVFRNWLSPNIQRRLRNEPALRVFKNCKDPINRVINCKWDSDHLAHYLKVSAEFAHWYKRSHDDCKRLSLVTVLARINAVMQACNAPHVYKEGKTYDAYTPVTSKQVLCVERVKHWVGAGRKVIVYMKSPAVAKRLNILLEQEGIRSLVYTGDEAVQKRAKKLDQEFRFGKTDVLLASKVGQKGLNLEQASIAIFYDRDWSASSEAQALYRMLRPAQQNQVYAEYLHLEGGIDSYQDQMVSWKKKSEEAGIDFGEGVDPDEEFMHLDSILHEFCDSVLGMNAQEARLKLCA